MIVIAVPERITNDGQYSLKTERHTMVENYTFLGGGGGLNRQAIAGSLLRRCVKAAHSSERLSRMRGVLEGLTE